MATDTKTPADIETLARWADEDAAYAAVAARLGREERLAFRNAWTGELVTDTEFLTALEAELVARGIK